MEDITKLFDELQNSLKDNLPRIISLRDKRQSKEDKSFVTEGDLLVNSLVEELCSTFFNKYTFVSEELTDHKEIPTEGYIIVLDPVDGTENFTSGLPEWGVSLACFHNAKHIGSFLACPEMDLWIRTGDKLKKNFSRIRGLSSSLSKEDLIEATQGHEYRVIGCCVYNMINVIKGSYISFENPKGAKSWDILAGFNLALEHQLTVTVNGKPYDGSYLQADQRYKFKVENK